MIGMVNALAQSDHPNAPAGFTVVPPEESGTGSYVLTFKKAAADGETLYKWSDIAENGSLDFLLDATSLKIVTENGCTLSDSDMEKLMGGDNANTLFPNLQSLDMGDAVLEENGSLARMRYAKGQNATGLTNLTSFTFPKTTTSIPAGAFNENTKLQEIIMLEGSLTTITEQAFQGCTRLSNVRIPDGITTIGTNAFENCAFENISFPNSLKRIETNAFGSCRNLKSITIPMNVTYIGPSAFQKNNSMTDVYVLGNNVLIPNGAFNEEETYNFNYVENNDGVVDFYDWTSSSSNADARSPHPLRLHIPDNVEAKKNYINPYQRILNDPRMTNEMLDNFDQHKDEIKAIIGDYDGVDPSGALWYYQPNSGIPCYVEMDGRRYFRGGNGKFASGNNGQYGACGPYAGWRNFMLVAEDVAEKTWPDNRMKESRWYSAVFPFNMSYNQVMTAYGAKTDVREFTYVNEHTVNNAKVRTVTFATIPVIPNNDKNEAGFVKKGMPYMIHPGVRCVPVTVGEGEEQTTVYRTIAGVDVDVATAELDNDTKPVTKDLVDGDNNGATLKSEAYTFKGTYKLANIPENTFYLGYDPDPDHYYPLAFYVTRKELVNKWNPFTSIVQHADESGNANSAKTMDLGFKDDGFEIMHGSSIATAIEAAPVVSNMNDGKVYNLSGQAVRESRNHSLAKGVYIIDGKKVVIR